MPGAFSVDVVGQVGVVGAGEGQRVCFGYARRLVGFHALGFDAPALVRAFGVVLVQQTGIGRQVEGPAVVVVRIGGQASLRRGPHFSTDRAVVLEHVAQFVTGDRVGEAQLFIADHPLRRKAIQLVLGGEEPGANELFPSHNLLR